MDEVCGKFRSILDLDGQETSWAYDVFGRDFGGLRSQDDEDTTAGELATQEAAHHISAEIAACRP